MKRTILLSLMLGAFAVLTARPSSQPTDAFDTLVNQYFNFYFSSHPSEGTAAGLHQYDTQLEDYSAQAQQKQIQGLKDFLTNFEAMDASKLPADKAADRQWIISSIQSALLELEDVQMWRKDPDNYS